VAKVRRRLPFEIDAWVVLPEHMHAVWSLPDADTDFPTRWRSIKTFFAKRSGRASGYGEREP
jgi:putative transposase